MKIRKDVAVLMPTISRWGYSVYERADDIRTEKNALNTLGQIIEDLADAEILITHSKLEKYHMKN